MSMHPFTATTLALALCAAWPAMAADPPPPDDLDALSLADKAPQDEPRAARPWRLFAEAAAGRSKLGDGGPRIDMQRLSLDLRVDARLAPGLRAVLSNRLDLVHDNASPPADDVNTVREAYLSWAPGPHQVVDLGRVNVRHGAAMGYNPTDWFKEGALRSVVSADPAVLRENRQGTVVLQGQQLWGAGSLTATLSPKLASAPDDDTFAFDAGATNPRHRWLLAASHSFGPAFSPQLLLHGGTDTPIQLGLNLSAPLGDATVVYGEFSLGKGPTLADKALGIDAADRRQRRAAVGVTYTTAFNLSVTAEAEYNRAAPDRGEWNALAPAARQNLLAWADRLQDLPVRRAWFLHATWKDFLQRRLDLSAYLRRDAETGSSDQWLEARYRWERADLSLQWQRFGGDPGSVFRTVPRRQTVEVALRCHF